MEIKSYLDYDIADLSNEDLQNITKLENVISSNTHEDIVLIAYKHINSDQSTN